MGTSTKKTKAAPQPESLTNKSELKRQLAYQLTTVFIVALLCLWLAATRTEVSVLAVRMPWWYFVIISAIALPLWLLMGRKKNARPRRRWGLFCVALGFIWLMYFILWIPFESAFFYSLAGVLLALTVLLLLYLGLIITGRGTETKLGKVIKWIVEQRGFYEPLSALVVFASIFLGWKMLGDAGLSDWWMIPLFLLGMLVFVVVGLVYVCTSHSGSNRK